MNSLIPRLSLATLTALSLSACSVGDGGIELAVSETCAEVADSKCISVNGENVVRPAEYERAEVSDASAADAQGPNTVDVTFTEDGAKVFHELTEKAAQGDSSKRLLVKVGGEIQAAVVVVEALADGRVQIDFSPEPNAQEAIDLIRAG
ncbi:MAG: SecDF P1 head subdomain-containing protein [Glutamicibacter sp.]